MDQTISTLIAAGVPTLAVIASFVRNESALAALGSRVANLELRLDARIETLDRDMRARLESMNGRIETLDRDLREWAKITRWCQDFCVNAIVAFMESFLVTLPCLVRSVRASE